MTRGRRPPKDQVEALIERIERAGGKAVPGDVLELCAHLRAVTLTNRAQREVLATHVRTINDLRRTLGSPTEEKGMS